MQKHRLARRNFLSQVPTGRKFFMDIKQSDIDEFKHIYFKHFRIELEDTEAEKILKVLVKQVDTIYRPITEKQFNNLKKYTSNDN